MIRAYDEALFEAAVKDMRLADFIDETLIAAEPAKVRADLLDFVAQERPAPEVREVIDRLLDDDQLMAKVRLVSDRSWRNCVLAITPERATVTQGGITFVDGSCDLDATLTYWRLHAEQVFLQVGPTEAQSLERTLGESMEYLLFWLFKRYFGKVAS